MRNRLLARAYKHWMPSRSTVGLALLAVLAFAGGTWMAKNARQAVPPGTETQPIAARVLVNGSGTTTVGGPCEGVTVLEFFASWCSVCESTLPELERGAPADARWVSIGLDRDADTVVKTAAAWHLEKTVVHDADGALSRAYGVRALPTLIVLAADGTVVESLAGRVSPEELRDGIARARAY